MKIKTDYLLVLIVSILAYLFIPDDYLDLYRYYEGAQSISLNESLSQFITDTIRNRFDFIYFSSFYVVRLLNLPINLVNAFYVGFCCYQAINIINYVSVAYNIKSNNLTLFKLFTVFSVPFIYLFSISRMAAAISFFFLGINKLLRGYKFLFIICCILTLFTHVGSGIYIFLFIFCYFVAPSILPKVKNSVFILSLLPIIYIIKKLSELIVNSILNLPFFSSYIFYKTYLTKLEIELIDISGQSRIVMIHTLWYVCIYTIGLLNLKNNDRFFSSCKYLYVFVFISLFLSLMFIQRSIMFTFPLMASIFLIDYNQDYMSPKKKLFYRILMYITILLGVFVFAAYFFRGFFGLFK